MRDGGHDFGCTIDSGLGASGSRVGVLSPEDMVGDASLHTRSWQGNDRTGVTSNGQA